MSEKGKPPIPGPHAYGRVGTAATLLSLALAVTACSDSNRSSGPGYQTGVLIDSAVEGVSYSTATESGVTNAAGEFRYQSGETVTFTLGSVELGSVPATAEVTVFDLAEVTSTPNGITAFYEQFYTSDGGPTPLQRATNIAVLLQSLDDDANPDNGINIPANVASLVTPQLIDLDEDPYAFRIGGNGRNGLGLPRLLRDAAAAGDLTPRPAVNLSVALDHAAAEAGVDFGLQASQTYTADNDGDGSIDTRRETTYAANGQFANEMTDSDGDGAVDTSSSYTYADNTSEIRYERDDDADGAADFTRTKDYDEFGAQIRSQSVDAGGAVIGLEIIEYDLAGRMIMRETGNRTSRTIQFWRVDDNDMRSTYEIDSDGDGSIDRRDLLAYPEGENRSDRWTGRDIDQNLDGVLDGRQDRTLDERGRVLRDVQDLNLDGMPEYDLAKTYGEHGIASQTLVRENLPTQTLLWSYDSAGNLVRYTFDSDSDGSPDRVTDYQIDSNGRVAIQESDYDGDGTIDSITSFQFDAEGRTIGYEVDDGADGGIDNREVRTFNDDGQILTRSYDRGADGTIDVIDTYSDWVPVATGYAF